mmetsp:Transcript_3849/g.14308  ORF Transcript_3849/g.14308 Transcript_3849/m.14308 type:complete len:207 (+) Transcript_3849:938-1558(+)
MVGASPRSDTRRPDQGHRAEHRPDQHRDDGDRGWRHMAPAARLLHLAAVVHHSRGRHHPRHHRARRRQNVLGDQNTGDARRLVCDGPRVLPRNRHVRPGNSFLRCRARRDVLPDLDLWRHHGDRPVLPHRPHIPGVRPFRRRYPVARREHRFRPGPERCAGRGGVDGRLHAALLQVSAHAGEGLGRFAAEAGVAHEVAVQALQVVP